MGPRYNLDQRHPWLTKFGFQTFSLSSFIVIVIEYFEIDLSFAFYIVTVKKTYTLVAKSQKLKQVSSTAFILSHHNRANPAKTYLYCF